MIWLVIEHLQTSASALRTVLEFRSVDCTLTSYISSAALWLNNILLGAPQVVFSGFQDAESGTEEGTKKSLMKMEVAL